MLDAAERVQSFCEDFVGVVAGARGDEADTAAVMFLTVKWRGIHTKNAFNISTKKPGETQAGPRGRDDRTCSTWILPPGIHPAAGLERSPFFGYIVSPRLEGEVAEWLKALVSKTSIGVSLSRVRIPPSPQKFCMPRVSRSVPIADFSACPNRAHLSVIYREGCGNRMATSRVTLKSKTFALDLHRSACRDQWITTSFLVWTKLPARIL